MKSLAGYLIAVAAVAIVTACLIPLRENVNSTTVSLTFLVLVLSSALICGSRPALLTSLLAAFSLNFFFLPPYYTLSIAEPENWIALAVFLIVALTVGQLSATAKRRADVAGKLYADLESAFEQASEAEAVRRSEKLKSALLDAVTHDLRTPLTSIKAAVTMLIQEGHAVHTTLEPLAQADLLTVIDEESDHLNAFIESMVDVARFEARAKPLTEKIIPIEDLISDVVIRCSARTRGREVSIEVDAGGTAIKGDERAISQAILNLIDNAAKYSPAGSPIHVSARLIDDKVRIEVEDQGPGVLVSQREKIFDKFHRGDRRTKGYGLGLAIVRGIVEAHDGRAFVEDGRKGARFVIELETIKI